jgi:hypothetical protein
MKYLLFSFYIKHLIHSLFLVPPTWDSRD